MGDDKIRDDRIREWAGWKREPVSMCGCRGCVHRIECGDTLYLLGKKYHVTVDAIMNANPYVDIYNLQIGDELCIPALTSKM